MFTILLLECRGNLKEIRVKPFGEEDAYRRCGYKVCPPEFKMLASWNIDNNDNELLMVTMYGKNEGRKCNENIIVQSFRNKNMSPDIDLPIPIAYGPVILVATLNGNDYSFTEKEWLSMLKVCESNNKDDNIDNDINNNINNNNSSEELIKKTISTEISVNNNIISDEFISIIKEWIAMITTGPGPKKKVDAMTYNKIYCRIIDEFEHDEDWKDDDNIFLMFERNKTDNPEKWCRDMMLVFQNIAAILKINKVEDTNSYIEIKDLLDEFTNNIDNENVERELEEEAYDDFELGV
tara:strand:- start:465 stop:1346 length:882 start_codon:yes stop_codon:yes gene_type:complete